MPGSHDAGSSRRWRLYALLALLRVVGSVLFLGMVHPDEFFQSQEVMARHVLPESSPLRRELFLPWEFASPSPSDLWVCGTSVLVAGGPYKLLELLGLRPSGLSLLLLPRLLLCGLSFLIDAILYVIAGKMSARDSPETQQKLLLLLGSSWSTLVFLCRPFSNTFETLVLALCFAALFLVNPVRPLPCSRHSPLHHAHHIHLRLRQHRRVGCGALHVQTLLLGSLLAVGFFTRFTFPVFFFPLGVELVRQQDALLVAASRKKADTQLSLLRRLMAVGGVLLQGLGAFVTCALLFIAMDTLYFRPEAFQDASLASLARNAVVAPLNNLLYNLQYDNLELHGVHPLLTHLTVNMPMLFGPMFLVFLVGFLRHPDRSFFGSACVFFPLVCLSLAPHQEPRFMLPTLVPLHLFIALKGPSGVLGFLTSNRLGVLLWVTFNLAMTLFFGVLHQGGIVPLLLSLSTGAATSAEITLPSRLLSPFCRFDHHALELMGTVPLIFAKTYMPPRFLLAGMTATHTFRVVDLAGKSVDDLPTLLGDNEASSSSPEPVEAAFLVLPASVSLADVVPESTAFVSSSSRVGGCFPHISTEDLALDKPLSLDVYLLKLTAKPAENAAQ
ncbi:hypothetical protein BBJ28_00020140 [Nothophytophthora sp. Chile5]|nr:hypothetical protein BBJ28_00020140 [Nothophytophthora sp. Chile5]